MLASCNATRHTGEFQGLLAHIDKYSPLFSSCRMSSSLLAKQKQKGADRMMLPAVEGHVGGKWVVIDSGTVIVHALDEKARTYYDWEAIS
ncbi:hypothetical protein KSP40_PGU021091 [Platanthera guangdongensis]|uniref:Uncharacterized protein n=1 Tax=Platanthera guangdongensis TaxID=2320717 RepID=A0ABR2MHQ4_9ASPA